MGAALRGALFRVRHSLPPCCAVNGVFVADADGDHLACAFLDFAVDDAETLGSLVRDVELDPRESGEVTTDVTLAQ